MDDNFTNAPRSRSSGAAKLIGYGAIALLVIAILLLATGVVNFEQRGFFG
jgi:ABC-type Na+ efflux pump permease subunit